MSSLSSAKAATEVTQAGMQLFLISCRLRAKLLHWCYCLTWCCFRKPSAREACQRPQQAAFVLTLALGVEHAVFFGDFFAQFCSVTTASALAFIAQSASKVVVCHVCIASARKHLNNLCALAEVLALCTGSFCHLSACLLKAPC